uniref:Invasion associated locus B family protein n=1 Tax=OCS116 cluster bacterium TaxID=2030921 RepID=A0A2A4Z9Z0_9PROT
MNKYLIATLALLAMMVNVSAVNAATQTSIATNVWALNCATAQPNDTPAKCIMNHQDEKTSAAPFSISIEFIKLAKNQRPVALAIITSPMNILLQSGIRLTPDKASAVNLAYRSCHADINRSQNRLETLCIAPFQLNAKLEQAFKRGASFSLQAQTLNGKTISQTVSLIGFTKTFTALKKQMQ